MQGLPDMQARHHGSKFPMWQKRKGRNPSLLGRSSIVYKLKLALLALLAASLPGFGQTPLQSTDSSATPTVSTPADSSDGRDRIFFSSDTERAGPLAHKLIANILLDQKEIWTSPFRMHANDAKWWIGFGALTGVLIATDKHTSTVFENSQGQISWGNRISRVGAAYTLVPVVAGFYGYGVLRDDPKSREVGVLGTEALLDSLIVAEVLKAAARRERPDSTKEKGHFFAHGNSFPSGHAIESWALASVVAHEYGKQSKLVPVVAYGLAAMVSTARFAAQRHYASDIVAGGAMGWFIGRYVYQTHVNHTLHKHAWLLPTVTPDFHPMERSYGVALTFATH